ncbi:hypothetical protein V6N12_045154 [Hibiscus sabdariffa]|uniref:Uncharacterized protein n=1 Tax=Hibiscus sabdariffa TaxID=183260 RepID=A0ABR2G314_9ROSI
MTFWYDIGACFLFCVQDPIRCCPLANRVEIGLVYGVDFRCVVDCRNSQLLGVIFRGCLTFSEGQLFIADSHRGWSVDFFCFGQNLHPMICGALRGKQRKVPIWTKFLYGKHGWHWFIYGLIVSLKSLPPILIPTLLVISGILNLIPNQLFSLPKQRLLVELLCISPSSLSAQFPNFLMSDILKMIANLRFTEEKLGDMETLSFEEEHQVEGSESWLVGKVLTPIVIDHELFILVFRAV